VRIVAVVPTEAWLPLDCSIMMNCSGIQYHMHTCKCDSDLPHGERMMEFKLIGLYLGESNENLTNFSPTV
jgi:hypothetical protein